jgi:D-psicose/D-tagatose/L-ribulose 3-epimerase
LKYSITLSSFRNINEALEKTLERLVIQGYDAVEVLALPDKSDLLAMKETLDTFDLQISGISGMWGTLEGGRLRTNLLSYNSDFANRCYEYAKYCLEICRLLDGKQVNICVTSDDQKLSPYQMTHEFRSQLDKRHIMEIRIIPILAGLTRIAKDHDVRLLLEPLNRYCSQYCNRAEEAADIAKEINHENFGILLDTYHMNIEEDSIESAIRDSGDWLRHTHFADNNRKMPGYGHIEFRSIIDCLKKIGYDEYICFEPNLSLTDFMEPTRRGLEFIKSIEASG